MTKLERMEEAGEFYKKALDAREQLYTQNGTAQAQLSWSNSLISMGDHLTKLGQMEEAGAYYQKYLETAEKHYEQKKSAATLWTFLLAHDKLGDNKHARGLYEEAHTHRMAALELFEQCVKLDSSKQRRDAYFRKKVNVAP